MIKQPPLSHPPPSPGQLVIVIAALFALSSLPSACGSTTCQQGRVKNVDGVCVQDQMADFVECINNVSGKSISREDAFRLAATIGTYGGVSHAQQRASRTEYAGPSERNQLLVIDHCMRLSRGNTTAGDAAESGDTLVQQALADRSDEMFQNRVLRSLRRAARFDGACQARHGLPLGYHLSSRCSSVCGTGYAFTECERKYEDVYRRVRGACVQLLDPQELEPRDDGFDYFQGRFVGPDEHLARCCPAWVGAASGL